LAIYAFFLGDKKSYVSKCQLEKTIDLDFDLDLSTCGQK
jgi:hypothetical protein